MSSSTRPEQGGLEVGVGRHLRQDLLPGAGGVLPGWRGASRGDGTRPSSTPPSGVRRASGRARAGRASPPPRRPRTGGPRPARAPRRENGAPPRRSGSPWSRPPGGRRARRRGAAGQGRSRAGAPARSSTPARYSTTTPSMRRSSPQTFSTSSASCRPSTKIRLARATRAVAPCTATEPDAVRVGLAGPWRTGAARITGRPSSRKPGPSGKVRRLPRRSSRVSVSRSRSTATISPQKSVITSSTTAPISATAGTARPFFGARQSPASTSEP